jgi:hypothetical protein
MGFSNRYSEGGAVCLPGGEVYALTKNLFYGILGFHATTIVFYQNNALNLAIFSRWAVDALFE